MLTNPVETAQRWNVLQEPRCKSPFPSGNLLLLSALDQGWQVTRLRVEPSWDQHGFVYLLVLEHPLYPHNQELVLPRNPQLEAILAG
jgi:hypothetical protein